MENLKVKGDSEQSQQIHHLIDTKEKDNEKQKIQFNDIMFHKLKKYSMLIILCCVTHNCKTQCLKTTIYLACVSLIWLVGSSGVGKVRQYSPELAHMTLISGRLAGGQLICELKGLWLRLLAVMRGVAGPCVCHHPAELSLFAWQQGS